MEKVEKGWTDHGSARRFSSRCHRPHPLSEEDALGTTARSNSAGPSTGSSPSSATRSSASTSPGDSERERIDGAPLPVCRATSSSRMSPRYVEEMRSAYVIVDDAERMQMMKAAIRAIEAKTGATAVADADLLEEICYITEYPHGLMGTFDDDVPRAAPGRARQRHERATSATSRSRGRTGSSSPPSSSLPTRFRPTPPR